MPFVEGGIVVDAEPQQQAAPPMAQGGFVQGGIEVDPTPDDSYNKVLQFQAAQTDYTPSKQEFLDYLKVSKTKPLLGEKPLETIGTAAVQTVEDIASMPYKLGEAIGQYMDPPEGVTPMQVAGGTAAEIAVQSRLKAENMGRGLIDTALNKLSDITGKLRNDDDKYEAFLAAAEIKRQLARANAPGDQRVPASQDVLQAYGIPQEAISQQGLDVGGFLADPSSIAFAGGGKLASALAQRAIPLIPRAGQILQRTGERISNLGRAPENMAGRFTAGVTGSEQMGQAVQEGIAKGTTGITLGEAAGLPITMNVPGLGTVAKTITATKGLGGAMETVGEAGTVSGGPSLTATQRGLLGAGERIAAAEGASSRARALGTALARSGLETPIRGAATILLPMAGAGAAGGALAALTGEEGDAVAAAIGSGAGFGVFDGGFTLAKAVQANAFNGGRVRQTAVDDLNTRPTDVQFTYIDPVAGEQTATIKDSEARATLYGRLNNKQLTKALSEVAGAEGAGVDVIFHTDADTVPAGLQNVNYAGVAIGPDNIKSGKPTILINVDKASPEALPHEILHARITQDMVSQLGAKAIDTASADPNFQRQFTDFANKYADKLQSAGGRVVADRIRTELRDAFDPAQQRAQKVESLKRITDEFAAYYTQEMLKGKDPKTMLPGRIPSFFEMALNNAKEAVSERFTRRALQAGFDPVARTFYDANGRRIKLDWMEDAIKNLVTPKEGYEPTEQRVDINKMTQAQQNAVIMARGYSDLFMTAPDGSIVRPLSKAELAAKTADIANRTMRVVESVPQAERTSISGMDAYGNPVIEGRLSLAEADAVSKSGIFGPSSSRTLIDIATAIRDGTLMEGSYWKVYGSTGKSGVFGESQKLFLPYGISINSKGGVNVKVVDWGKVQARMYKALSKPAYKSLFNNYDQAMSTMRDVYLKNIAETGAVPSAEALGGGIEGAKKRNMFNEIMGAVPKKGDVMVNFPTAGYVANRKGGSVYQDLRLERIQNADSTKAQIPWTGDMGEQSSYRRTQLNFMPAEAIGETKVSTDENGGYRILSKNGKFRLYGPDGSTVGIFDTQEQAKLKAEKDYATQERIQPEVSHQQRPLGDEGRQAAEAGGRNRAFGGQEGQVEGGAVRQADDVRFMPAEEEAARKQVAEGLPRRASFEAPGVSRDQNGNIYFKGKEPKDWTPKEFEEYGKAFGVENLGPLSEITNIPSDVAGDPARIPGGLEGKFTYYDLLWLKTNPVDVANLPETTHAKLTAKLAATMAPTPGDKVSSFNSIVFGMLSPNAPLLPNEMGMARLRFGSMEDVRKFASLYPENPTKENLKELNQRLKKELGFISAGKGGLGIAITADISNIVNAARLFTKNPDFFVKKANESWADFVDKLTTQIKGFGTKTGSFGSVWQDPLKASISAMDRHMARIFGQELLGNPELRKRFEGIVVDRFNSMLKKSKEATSAFNRRLKNAEEKGKRIEEINKDDPKTLKTLKAKNDKRIKSIKAEMASTLDSLPDPTATRAKTIDDVLGQAQIYGADRVQKFVNEAVFAAMGSRKATLIAKKGGINPNAPANIKSVEWVETPKDFQVMSDSYRSALEINERRANELGVAVFPAQWTLWDRIRGRVEPHEVMFPGLDKLPALNDRQLGEAQKANKAAGYGSTPEAGEKWKRKQIDSPSRLAYFMPAGEGEKLYEQGRPEQGGDRGGRLPRGSYTPLDGAPNVAGATGPAPGLVDVARSYAAAAGISHRRQAVYVEVDEARARRLADAYAEMKHAPQDPKVQEAYADMIRQTKDQYQALVDAGYEFSFFDSSSDPYKGNPSAAMRDLRANKRMAVYGTYDGYGTEGITGAEIKGNPMLEPTGLTWPDQRGVMHPVVANDLFRAVHDAFGHGLEGASFRARGEENAWQAHVRLFTGPAIAAITSETRGQNSWLNYGPHGERNRTAKLEDTVFSPQKTGLMPDWTWNEGLAPDEGASVEGQRYMPAGVETAPKRYENVDSFREHWNALGVRNMTDIRAKGTPYEHIRPSEIEVDKASRNKGLGTAFMEDLVAFADLTGKQIRINPSDELGATSKGRLEKFYKQFGFVENKPGKNKDYAISERFYRQPSSGERFMPASDTDYLSAVKKGDTATAQQMVDEAAKAAKYTTKAFHRSSKEFDAFIPGGPGAKEQVWTTKDGAARTIFGQSGRAMWFGTNRNELPAYHNDPSGKGSVKSVYLKNPSPLQVDDDTRAWAREIYADGSKNFPLLLSDEHIQSIKNDGYTGIEYWENGKTADQGAPAEIVVFDPTQIKSADPITKDNAGNVIPLSQRFKATSEDIRYMPSPDSAMPGAYSFPGGYRALPGKAKGSLRLYGPAGSLIGIASSLDEAQRILRRKNK
jgi:GNAT superfamily N-acetyltransferase